MTAFVDVGDPSAPIGSAPWCRASHLQLCAVKNQTSSKVRDLKYHLLEFKQRERWKQLYDDNNQPFMSWEDYVQYPEPNGLGIPLESVQAVTGVANDDELLGTVLRNKRGRPKKGEESGIRHLKTSRLSSGSVSRILLRLDRDRPDLAAKVRAGEMSARAAAIKAGWPVKRKCPNCGHEW